MKRKVGEDLAMTYKQLIGLSQNAFCDEMFDACRHFINWNLERVHRETRPHTNQYTANATSKFGESALYSDVNSKRRYDIEVENPDMG